ncbi:hypothetical protein O5559_27490, partial [Escherichia coli]|nr:hypothetical protein [Escherichia coli]
IRPTKTVSTEISISGYFLLVITSNLQKPIPVFASAVLALSIVIGGLVKLKPQTSRMQERAAAGW